MKTSLQQFITLIEREVATALQKPAIKITSTPVDATLKNAKREVEATRQLLERQAELQQELQGEFDYAEAMLKKRKEQHAIANDSDDAELIAFAQQEVTIYTNRQLHLAESLRVTTNQYVAMERRYEEMKHLVKDMELRQLYVRSQENNARASEAMDNVMQAQAANAQAAVNEAERNAIKKESKLSAQQQEDLFDVRIAALQKQA